MITSDSIKRGFYAHLHHNRDARLKPDATRHQGPRRRDRPKAKFTENARRLGLGNEDKERLFVDDAIDGAEQVLGGFSLGDKATGASEFGGFRQGVHLVH
jgi:hypothetical protein